MAYRSRQQVRFGHVDHARIVYYPRYLDYFHVAFEEFWREALGVPYATAMTERRLGFPAVHLDVHFREPLRFGDAIDVEVAIGKTGATSIEWHYTVYRAADGCLAGRARITTVTVDIETFHKLPTPAWLIGKLAAHRMVAPEEEAREKGELT